MICLCSVFSNKANIPAVNSIRCDLISIQHAVCNLKSLVYWCISTMGGFFLFCYVCILYYCILSSTMLLMSVFSSAISLPQRFLTGFLKLFQFNYIVTCKMSFDSIFFHFNRISRMRREWKKNIENVLNFLQLWFFLQIKPHHLTNLLAVSVWMDY